MKRAAIAVSTLLVASLGMAGETSTQSTKTAKTAAPAVATPSVQPAAADTDSPLVKAAKTTNRAKKRIVITNESLKNSTGHVTTTKSQPPVYDPPMTEKDFQRRQAAIRSTTDKSSETKQADPEKAAKVGRLADEADDPYSEMDPAMLEHQLEKNAQQAPKEEKKRP